MTVSNEELKLIRRMLLAAAIGSKEDAEETATGILAYLLHVGAVSVERGDGKFKFTATLGEGWDSEPADAGFCEQLLTADEIEIPVGEGAN